MPPVRGRELKLSISPIIYFAAAMPPVRGRELKQALDQDIKDGGDDAPCAGA